MRRLRIIDVAGRRQPVVDETGSTNAVFNGEIYNYRQLRRRLELAGHNLTSRGDSAALVHLYEDHGKAFGKTLRGMFALGMQPTGSKDPFALRRQANGIVKTIAEKKLPISLKQLFTDARDVYRGSNAEEKFSPEGDYAGAIRSFFRERLEFYLREALGLKYDVVNAVLAAGSDDVVDAVARAEAVTSVRQSADFESISIAFKRIKNILRQASETRKRVASVLDAKALQDAEEKELAAQIPRAAEMVDALRAQRNYEQALVEISKLRPAVDRFFDKVMVMVEDEHLRANRLALLQTLFENFSTVADFSEIVTEGKDSKESPKE
jgi:glycyl-tRNA synthetase beta chain